MRGLRLRVGKLRSTREYYSQYRKAGDVVMLREVIGHFPEVKTLTARKEADLIAGKIAGGTGRRGRWRTLGCWRGLNGHRHGRDAPSRPHSTATRAKISAGMKKPPPG